MNHFTLHIPILVRQFTEEDGTHYHLQPLFTGYPNTTHHRFEKAINLIKKEVSQLLKGTQLQRDPIANGFLWYAFSPKFEYLRYQFAGTIGKRFLRGVFGLVYFKLKDKHFLMFPTFKQKMIMLEPGANGKVNKKEEALRILESMLRELYKNDPEFDEKPLMATKKEFITNITQHVRLSPGQFNFEERPRFNFFQFFQPEVKFDGYTELEKVGFNYNDLFPSELGRAYLQDELVDQLYRLMYQTTNTPFVLVGEEGVGKHAVLQESIYRYLNAFYEETKGRKQSSWHLDPTRVISGMSIVGMWEKRFEAMLDYLCKPLPGKVKPEKMLVDNAVALLRIGKSGSNDLSLSHVLKPYLEKRRFQLMLIATPNEWKLIQEKDRGFADLFQVIRMQPVRVEQAMRIALYKRRKLEREFECEITVQAINQLFNLQRNFLANKALPGGVIRPLRQLVSKHRGTAIDAPEVRAEFKHSSGLKEEIFDENLTIDPKKVRQEIAAQLIGQEAAVEALTDVVHLIKSKLANQRKPLSSFLFIGPTGVGKTQAAKVLCQFLMGSDRHLMRFDMNEYNDSSAVARLIGDYQNPEGLLTGKVRYQPFGVLLLDEIEKAHPNVRDVLLQVLDDGRLTDSRGRTVDFTNTVIIMTSNLGAEEIDAQVGFKSSSEGDDAIYMKAIRNHFRPEFFNRIEEVVIFRSLEVEHILSIARLQIRELLQRDGFVRRTTILNITQDALEWVAHRGFDKKMGGRALKRQIERDLTKLSAEQLISSHIDNPILLNIHQEADRLSPRIVPITFTETIDEAWMPELPDVEKGKGFYNRLLEATQELERELDTGTPDNPLVFDEEGLDQSTNYEYYNFKNQLAELKEKLQHFSLGFRDRYFKTAPAIPFRLKSSTILTRTFRGHKAEREMLKDILFQQDALRQINQQYEFGSDHFDRAKTEFLEHFLDLAMLKIQAKGVLEDRIDRINIQFNPLITGMGQRQVKKLLVMYQTLLKSLEVRFRMKGKGPFRLEAEGYGLKELFSGEQGVHLFYLSQQNPIPIRMIMWDQNEEKPSDQITDLNVIRIYEEGATLSDLRSGFTSHYEIHPNEFKLLLYAGLDTELRAKIAPL